jgi:hypothetical protein
MAVSFSGGNAQSLRFPKELGTDEVPNYVTFRPTLVEFGRYEPGKTRRETFGNAYDFNQKSNAQRAGEFTFGVGPANITIDPFSQLRSQVGGIVDNISNGVNQLLGAIANPLSNFKFSQNISLFGGAINARVDLGGLNLDRNGKMTRTTIQKLPGINLYLPPDLQNKVSAEIGTPKLGAAGNTAVDLVDQGFYYNSDTGSYGGAAGKALQEIATASINDAIRDTTFGNAVQVATGRVANNYSYALFNGMQHREFKYTFKLIARNENESKVIKDICDSFIYYMLPVRSPDDFHFYDVPCMWEISYNRYGEKIDFLDQPNNCFLKNVEVNYGKGGMGQTYNNGAPIDVDLVLSFTEIEPLVRAGARTGKKIRSLTSAQAAAQEAPGGGGGK